MKLSGINERKLIRRMVDFVSGKEYNRYIRSAKARNAKDAVFLEGTKFLYNIWPPK